MNLTLTEKYLLQQRIVYKRIPFDYTTTVGVERPDGKVVVCDTQEEYNEFITKNKLFQEKLQIKVSWNNYKIDRIVDSFAESVFED